MGVPGRRRPGRAGTAGLTAALVKFPPTGYLPSCQPTSGSGISAGQGPKASASMTWTRVAMSRYRWPAGMGFWMLACQSIDDPEDLVALGRPARRGRGLLGLSLDCSAGSRPAAREPGI
jgi:hypothetical protein